MPTLRESLQADIARVENDLASKKAALAKLEASPVVEFLEKEVEHVRDFVRQVSKHLFSSSAPALAAPPAPPVPAAAPIDSVPVAAAAPGKPVA